MRYRIQVVGWALIWGGIFIIGYLGWQLFGTDYVNAGVQARASEELASGLAAGTVTPDTLDSADILLPDQELPPGVPERIEYYPEEPVDHGESFAFLSIPKIGLDRVVVYQGVDGQTLKNGPGHMESTPLPGQPGNSVISGHRTTHGRPFFDFDLLEIGDRVEIESSVGTHIYEIREIQIVEPTAIWVTNPRPGGWITMTTCNPKFSARQRLVVWAEMIAGPNLDYVNLHKTEFPLPG